MGWPFGEKGEGLVHWSTSHIGDRILFKLSTAGEHDGAVDFKFNMSIEDAQRIADAIAHAIEQAKGESN